MDAAALNHLLRTLAAVPPGRRVLVRGAGEGRAGAGGAVSSALAQLGLEVHAAPWTEDAARRVHQRTALGNASASSASQEPADAPAPVYATAAPVHALPYPRAHFAWVVVLAAGLDASPAEYDEALRALLEEARHLLRPGGWVFATTSVSPAALADAATHADLAEAEAARHAGDKEPSNETASPVHGIYRRVEEHTPL